MTSPMDLPPEIGGTETEKAYWYWHNLGANGSTYIIEQGVNQSGEYLAIHALQSHTSRMPTVVRDPLAGEDQIVINEKKPDSHYPNYPA